MEDNLKKLHANLSEKWEGFSVPYEQFASDMSDEDNLKKLHSNLTSKWEGFSVPYEQFKSDMGVKKKEESGQDSKIHGKPFSGNTTPEKEIPALEKAAREVSENPVLSSLAPAISAVGNLSMRGDKKVRTKLDNVKKVIRDNYDRFSALDPEEARIALRNEVLSKTENAYIADEAVNYLDRLDENQRILSSEQSNEQRPTEFDSALSKIKEFNTNRINKNIPEVEKSVKPESIPNDKVYNDYANYLKEANPESYNKYVSGGYDDEGKTGADFYMNALTHQKKILDAKYSNGTIDEDSYRYQVSELNDKNKKAFVYFPEYNKELKARIRKQTEIDESYNEALSKINSSDPIESSKAKAVIGYYNVVAPAASAFMKFGVDFISSAGRMSAIGKTEAEKESINGFITDMNDYFDVEKSTSIYKLPSDLKGSLYENGEIQLQKLTPKLSETMAQMYSLILSGGKASTILEGAGVASKFSGNMGLFTSSFLSTQNQYYMDAKSNPSISNDEAMAYSLTSATTTSMLEMISPQEYMTKNILSGKASIDAVKDIANGVSRSKAIYKNFVFGAKEAGKEVVQEFSQEGGDLLNNYIFNQLTDADLKTSVGADEMLELVTLTAIVGGIGSTGGFKGSDQIRAESFFNAMNNQPDFDKATSEESNINNLGKEKIAKAKEQVKEFSKIYKALPEEYSENQKSLIAMNQIDLKELEARRRDEESIDEIISQKMVSKTDEEIAATREEMAKNAGIEAPPGKRLFNEPNPETKEIVSEYKQSKGLETGDSDPITEIDVDRAKSIADAFEAMEHNPNDPETKEAYQLMASETVEQYNAISDKGYTFEIYEGEGEPYKNSQEMINDLKNNKHLYILSTQKQFGETEITDEQRNENPLLKDSGVKDKNGVPLLVNDVFRGVHDFFGHSERGNSFGAIGEENAWDIHARMFSDKARRAMTTETRGQNSWVNFGKHLRNEDGSIKKKGDKGYLSPTEKPFAQQKIGLLPEEFSNIEEKYTKVLKGEPIDVDMESKGVYLNVGMKIGDTDQDISKSDIESKLPKDVEIIESTEVSGTEPTLSLQLSRPLTDVEMKKFLSETGQKAIPQVAEGKGTIYGSLEWGQFNPEYFVMPDRVVLSDKLKQSDAKEGKIEEPPKPPKTTERPNLDGDGKDVDSFSAYARGVIPKAEQYKHEWTPLITELENGADPSVILDRIDKIAEKVSKRESEKTKDRIARLITNKKSIARKVGKKWKGKVPIEVQDFISNFDLSMLDGMSLMELEQTHSLIKDILKAGRQEVAVNKRFTNSIKRRKSAKTFLALKEGSKPSKKANSKEEVVEYLEKQNKSVVLDGQLISSKSALEEYLKDHDSDFKDIDIYSTPKMSVAKVNESPLRALYQKLNPFTAKNNLWNNMIPVFKGSKALREEMTDLKESVNTADFNMEEEVYRKKNKYLSDIKKIFGKKSIALNILGKNADINPIEDYLEPPSNSTLVNLYNIARSGNKESKTDSNGIPITEGYEKLLKSGFDKDGIKQLFEYIEGNKELKEYSDYLIEDFYPSMKDDYEPTYIHLTNTKFPEGVYYPRFAETTNREIIDNGQLMDDNGNLNYKDAVAGNLKQRVNHNLGVNTSIGAHEVAMNYISTMERARQFVPVGEKVNAIFNSVNSAEIVKKIGTVNFNKLRDHLGVVITGQDPRAAKSNSFDFIVNQMMTYKIFGSLAFKLASIPKQLTSFTHFSTASGVRFHEWLTGFVPITRNDAKVFAEIWTSPYVKRRMQGRSFDIEVNRLLNSSKGSLSKRFARTFTRIAMSPITVGDIGGVLLGGAPLALAVYRKEKAKGKSHEEAIDIAYEKFVNESESAQQSTRAQETSHMQRDRVFRLFSAFTTSQTQTTNKLKAAVRVLTSKSELSNEEKVQAVYDIAYYSVANVGFAMVTNGMIKELFKGFDDEEEAKKGVYATIADNIQSILNGFGMTGIVTNFAINNLRGEDWKNTIPLLQEIGNISGSISTAAEVMAIGKPWDELSDSEKNKIIKLIPADSFLKQWSNLEKAAKDEDGKDFFDAVFNWTTEEEAAKYPDKNDKLWKIITGEDLDGSKRGGGRSSRRSERNSR